MSNTKKCEKFLAWVNETFKPEHPQHPVAVKTSDGEFVIHSDSSAFYPESTETALPIIDYYGEFRGNTPWRHPELERKAKEMGVYLEWRDPGSVLVYE